MQAMAEFVAVKGWAKDKSKRIVCLFSDSIRNYISKFLSTEWCVENRFLPYEELNEKAHIFEGVGLTELNLPEIKAYQDLTIK
jgi:hypothetical protein